MFTFLRKYKIVAAYIPALVIIFGAVWYAGQWKKEIEDDIAITRRDIARIDDKLKDITFLSNNMVERKGFEYHSGSIAALMNEKRIQARGQNTSYGVPYFLKFRICEVNESSTLWKKWNENIPFIGAFLEVKNLHNNLSVPCLVVGSFADYNHVYRTVLLSKVAASQINFFDGLTRVKIRYFPRERMCSDKSLLNILKAYKLRSYCNDSGSPYSMG